MSNIKNDLWRDSNGGKHDFLLWMDSHVSEDNEFSDGMEELGLVPGNDFILDAFRWCNGRNDYCVVLFQSIDADKMQAIFEAIGDMELPFHKIQKVTVLYDDDLVDMGLKLTSW